MKRTSVSGKKEHFERPTNLRLIIGWQREHAYVLNCNATLRSVERRTKERKMSEVLNQVHAADLNPSEGKVWRERCGPLTECRSGDGGMLNAPSISAMRS